MKLASISANMSYTGKLSCYVSFVGTGTTISHTCNEAQLAQLQAMIDEWRLALIQDSATALLSAKDDLLALEHKTPA
jgi:hypothetical protein